MQQVDTSRRFEWIASALLLAAVLVAGAFEFAAWLRSGLVSIPGDLDPYIRLVRVQLLLETGDWRGSSIPGGHLGGAEYLAWTRPLDALILGIVWPLRLWVADDTSLLLGGSLVSPLLWVACVPFLVGAARALGIQTFGALCVLVAFLCQPVILPDFQFGRGDHHSLLMLCAVLFSASFLRALDSGENRQMLWSGVVCGFGIWVNPEFTLFPALAILYLSIEWCRGDRQAARSIAAFSIGACGTIATAIVSEMGLTGLLSVEFDRVSLVHLSLLGSALVVGASMYRLDSLLSSQPARLLFAGIAGALSLVALEFLFPGFYLGPAQAMDPQLREVWFDRLVQSQSLLRSDDPDGIRYVVVVIFALACAAPALVVFRSRADCEVRRQLDFLLVAIACCFAVTLGFRRAASATVLFCLFPLGLLGDALKDRDRTRPIPAGNRLASARRGIASKGFVFFCAMAPHLILAIANAMGPEQSLDPTPAGGFAAERASCQRELHRWIQRDRIAELSGLDRALVITRRADAPALLYWTAHRVLAWNHHRSTEGLILLDRFFRAASEEELRDVSAEAGADLVLYCPGRSAHEPYWNRAPLRSAPSWMTQLAGEPDGAGPRLLAISTNPSN